METSRSTVIGLFTNIGDAQRAFNELQMAGFSPNEVRLVESDRMSDGTNLDNDYRGSSQDYSTNLSSTGTNNRADLSSTSDVSGHHKGGVKGFFSRLFGMEDEQRDQSDWRINEESAQYFTDHYQQNRHLVIVKSLSDQDRAIDIIQVCGGMIEDRASSLYSSGLQRTGVIDSTQTATSGINMRDNDQIADRGLNTGATNQSQVMQLREEELVMNKESVQTGEVRLHKEVITETKTIEVPVSREEVVIERHRLDGQGATASSANGINLSDIGENEEIRIPIKEEQVVVGKRVVPREEIIVTKEKREETETVSEDLRREEVHVEKDGRVALRDDDELDELDRKPDRTRPWV